MTDLFYCYRTFTPVSLQQLYSVMRRANFPHGATGVRKDRPRIRPTTTREPISWRRMKTHQAIQASLLPVLSIDTLESSQITPRQEKSPPPSLRFLCNRCSNKLGPREREIEEIRSGMSTSETEILRGNDRPILLLYPFDSSVDFPLSVKCDEAHSRHSYQGSGGLLAHDYAFRRGCVGAR